METPTQTEVLIAQAVEERKLIDRHYITQINQAITSGREDLIDELVALREAEATRSTSLMSLLKRAARHTNMNR